MKNLISCILLIISFSAAIPCKGVEHGTGANFSLKPLDSTEQVPDSISVHFWKENISDNYGVQRFKAIKNSSSFSISLPNMQHISKFYFIFSYSGKNIKSNVYYAEPFDIIDVLFKMKDGRIFLEFSGNRAIKYMVRDMMEEGFVNLVKQMPSAFDENKKPRFENDCGSPEFYDYFNKIFDNVSVYKKKNDTMLIKYAQQLGPDLSKFYGYEFNPTDLFLAYINAFYFQFKSEQCKKLVADFYFAKRDFFKYDEDHPWIKYSGLYLQKRGYQEMMESYYKSRGRGDSFKNQYLSLKAFNNLDLRDRLITQFLINPYFQAYIKDSSGKDSCLNDAYNTIKPIYLKKALAEQFIFLKGNPVYNFSMPDTLGNIVKLNDLKGKVFILDFYGEGCGGCASFAKQFKTDIYPAFKNHPSFKVVSVSVDKTKERWSKAMHSGLYTHKDFINLNTSGLGTKHPMLKYYNLNSLPFVLLVDKNGNLIARIDSLQSSEISALITQGLIEDIDKKDSSPLN